MNTIRIGAASPGPRADNARQGGANPEHPAPSPALPGSDLTIVETLVGGA
jgi:hypothetical protein